MEIKSLYFNQLRECCYVVWDSTLECVIIDPGVSSDDEFCRLCKFIADKSLKPVKILLTHGHFDHVMGVGSCNTRWGADVFLNPADLALMNKAEDYCKLFGVSMPLYNGPVHEVADGDVTTFGESSFKVLCTPGHTPGGVCYYSEADSVLFTGDTLFAGSIGRTDLEGGDYEAIMSSLEKVLMPLDGEVAVYPGHGPGTSIGYERATNPFLNR